ncbi:hypothetical protein HDU85_005028 [Gaertneriomyces sp. JEL0708]|nr:hypothetical protein HDU85_005028 [Gaertneriomyces sp. JEL0708]
MHIASAAVASLALASSVIGAAIPNPQWENINLPDESAVPPPTEGIVGGQDVPKGGHPWLAMLTSTSGSQFCGGSLIAPNLVLTAAHCVEGTAASRVLVKTRRWDKSASSASEGGIDFTVTKVITHPNYSSYANDIAVLVVKVAKNHGDAEIPTIAKFGDIQGDGEYTVAGWGATREGGSGARILQEVKVPQVDLATCRKNYSVRQIPDSVICAGAAGIDSCQGDSGGPLFTANGELSGIVSWGSGCARPGKPGVYTRVTSFTSWINNIKAENPVRRG